MKGVVVKQIKGILFDIGGVLYVGDEVVQGAVDTIAQLRKYYPLRFVTNTTRKLPKEIINKLHRFGFEIEIEELFTALDASRDFLSSKGVGVLPLLSDEVMAYFDTYISDTPEYVLVGDAYTNFDFEHMNNAFRALMKGAKLVAAAKNRYFQDVDNALSMDAGGFVAALEYASGQKAQVIGKPSSTFYHLAVASMGLEAKDVLMVGDDIVSDIKGAQDAQLQAALVKSGKFQTEDLKQGIVPDALLKDVTALVPLLL